MTKKRISNKTKVVLRHAKTKEIFYTFENFTQTTLSEEAHSYETMARPVKPLQAHVKSSSLHSKKRTDSDYGARTKKGSGFGGAKGYESCFLEYSNLSDKKVAEKIKKDTEGKVGIYLMENLVTSQKFVGVVRSAGKDRLGI